MLLNASRRPSLAAIAAARQQGVRITAARSGVVGAGSTNAAATRMRMLHVRSISFFTPLGRVAGRLAGRTALGVGAGAGTIAFADYKLKNLRERTSDAFESVGNAIDTLKSSASDGASLAWDRAQNATRAASEVWADTVISFEDRVAAIRASFAASEGAGEEGSGEEGGPEPPSDVSHRAAAAAAALAASLPLVVDDDGAEAPSKGNKPTEDLMRLTRRLIEIRADLLSLGEDAALTLPNIVVIGSQSSGKSSVLEAIVGREFLPKGDNMVTRRPIELTLVHTPPTEGDPTPLTYAVFPALGPGRITDFAAVQSTLTDLNLSVSAEECVSDNPIHLKVHSPDVPDLSLVDLPGYIQISSIDQPEQLKDRIARLCDKYIRAPNIILAVCAADVDLANSPALRASRRVDPLGIRTVGVVTKMDLVPPAQGQSILANDRYHLNLGYVGVICKPDKKRLESGGGLLALARRSGSAEASRSLIAAVQAQEDEYFGENAQFFSQEGTLVGTRTLKRTLMRTLENSMSSSLQSIANTIATELEEASYQFKVQYNDRPVSAETYLAETTDMLKQRIQELSKTFSKQEVNRVLKHAFEDYMLSTLAGVYWTDERLSELGKLSTSASSSWWSWPSPSDEKTDAATEEKLVYWRHKLDAATNKLTRSGVGRASTQLVVEAIRERVGELARDEEPLTWHATMGARVDALANELLHARMSTTAEQVENSIKPYKYEVDADEREWRAAHARARELLKRELAMCERAITQIQGAVGGSRKLNSAVEYVRELAEREHAQRLERSRARRQAAAAAAAAASAATTDAKPSGEETTSVANTDDDDNNAILDPMRPVFNPALLAKAREALFMSTRADVLRERMSALNSGRCASVTNEDAKAYCPEVFLDVVADKLAGTAVQFINIELLIEFFHWFPRELEARISEDFDTRDEVARFARENPRVREHLTLQERKRKLEEVSDKVRRLVEEQRQANGESSNSDASGRRRLRLFG